MSDISRREFMTQTAATTALLAGVAASANATSPQTKRTAVDRVKLGKTGMQPTRLGMGTGSHGGRDQRELGQAAFDRLVRYAFDQGIRYFDTADNYKTHSMLRSALKGLPRDELYIQSKIPIGQADKVIPTLQRFRRELGTDYIDSVLIHCARRHDWPSELERMRDDLAKAKDQKIMRAHGVSCHGLQPLSAAADCDWVDVGLVRINPQGKHVDGPKGDFSEPGDVAKVVGYMNQMHAAGKGIIGMKIIGNGTFTNAADREKSIRFAMRLACVDAVVIGFKNPAEIDEAIRRINAALQS